MSTVTALILGSYAWTRFRSAYGRTVAFVCLVIAVYAAGYALELRASDLEDALWWNGFQYLAVPLVAPMWALMAVEFRGQLRRSAWVEHLFLFLIPAVTMVIRQHPGLFHLLYASVSHTSSGPFTLLSIEKGPWYFVAAGHTAAVVLYATIQFAHVAATNQGQVRRHALLLLWASVFPFAAFIMLVSGLTPYGLDLVPVGAVVGVGLVMLGIARFQLLTIQNLARENVFEWTPDGLIILDPGQILVDFNREAGLIFPELKKSASGLPLCTALPQRSAFLQAVHKGGSSDGVEIIRGETGRFFQVRVHPLQDVAGQAMGQLVSLSDQTEQVQLLRQVERAATVDEMTGVYSRHYALELMTATLEKSLHEGRSFSLLLLDLDDFKRINDRHGHLVGDEALRQVAHLCVSSTREDDVVGRFGGDEFVIGLAETAARQALLVAERIRVAVAAQPLAFDGTTLPVTVSIGVGSLEPENGADLAVLLQQADRALYTAKARGRNEVCCGFEEDEAYEHVAAGTQG